MTEHKMPVECRLQDMVPGDALLLPEGLWTTLLHRRDLKYWFSAITERDRVSLNFIPNSPFTWHNKRKEFESVSGNPVFRLSSDMVYVFRGALSEEQVALFSDLPLIEKVMPISAEQSQTIIDRNKGFLVRMIAVVTNELPRDSYRVIRLLLAELQDYPQDVQAVLLSQIFNNVVGSQVAAALWAQSIFLVTAQLDRSGKENRDAPAQPYGGDDWEPIW